MIRVPFVVFLIFVTVRAAESPDAYLDAGDENSAVPSSDASNYYGLVLKYKGKSIGCLSGKGGTYKGKVNKLDEGKTYMGKASVSGNTLKLAGCVFGGLICKSENLKRQ